MHIFDDRARKFATEWARETEYLHRLRARRNRLLAEWAVAQSGVADPDQRVRTLMKQDFEPGGEAAFFAALADETGRDAAEILDRAAEFAKNAESDVIV